MKLLKKVIILVLFFTILFLVGLFFISKYYQEDIRTYLKNHMSLLFEDKLQMRELLDISILRSFPNLSLEARGVRCYELWGQASPEVLAQAEKVFIEIDLWQLMQGQIIFPSLAFEHGFVNIRQDSIWGFNFIAKQNADSSYNTPLDLKQVYLKNIHFLYLKTNKPKQDTLLELNCQELTLKGRFAQEQFLMKVSGDLKYLGHQKELDMLKLPLLITADVSLEVDKIKERLSIESFELQIKNMLNIDLQGTYQWGADRWDLNLQTNSFSFNQMTSWVNDTVFFNKMRPIQVKDGYGHLALKIQVDSLKNKIQGDFSFKQLSFEHDSLALELTDCNGVIHLKNTDTIWYIQADTLIGKVWDGTFAAYAFGSTDIEWSKWRMGAQLSDIQLRKISNTFPLNDFSFTEGGAYATISLDSLGMKGSLKMEQAQAKFKNELINHLNAKATWNHREISIQALSAEIQEGLWDVSGTIALETDSSNQHILNIHVSKLNLDPFLERIKNQESSDSGRKSTPWPVIQAQVRIDDFTYQKLSFEKVSFDVSARQGRWEIPSLYLDGFEGQMHGSLGVVSDQGGYVIQGDLAATKLDLKSLFIQMDNFSQSFITDQNLSGSLSGHISFHIPFEKNHAVLFSQIQANAVCEIDQGRLHHFQPLQEISQYIQENKLYASFLDYQTLSKKMESITFQKMSNELFIKQGKLFIPKMNISSSVLDFDVQGWHGFNDSIYYGIDFYLSDLLRKKEASLEDGIWEIKKQNKKWLKLFMGMRGTTINPEFFIRKKETKERIQQISVKERNTLKGMLKKDFGFYPKDTMIKTHQPSKDTPALDLEHPFLMKETDPVLDNPTKEKKTKNKKVKVISNSKEQEEYRDDF